MTVCGSAYSRNILLQLLGNFARTWILHGSNRN